ncbi:PepSY-associated TM helix domain-containing protein [Pedobacter heparinus]|uniref:PepSY-associated TM helix domain protein n=1 Tax=Pedobacter heparinus (strain ATCC 13125 / DSM 2366 / CIP 104194 / JCM 7457 / NBRC 12017 / NCIMB 9290 / NRRL B-14731 / HIM 762-3) TaxID=485917 RepID=C6Y1L0_PEDHD|nr:PepSY-associated TM helix domain-containing protein [Pedobacter heparinus]ACU02986.1 PepSY-associated TM helix domain protein [Pedobacter heparinus DSM 2366]
MNKRFKKIIRQIHLWLGLGTGLIVFVVSITGGLYVFEEEIREATQTDRLYVPLQQKPFIGLDKVIGNFEKLAPKEKITVLRITNGQANATVEIAAKNKIYYFNPYTGELVYKGGRDWLETVKEIHMTLLMGETGKFIQRWSVVIFVFMLITGLVLWFPRQLRLLKQSLSIKWKGSFKRINYDLHNVLGFYASWLLLVISLTGLFFAFKEVKMVASFFTGSKLSSGKVEPSLKPAVIEPLAIRYNRLYENMMIKYPGAVTTSISVRKGGELRLRMIYPYRWARNQNTFFFDEASGQLLRAKLYKEYNGADLVEATNYDLHTGRLFGLPGKIIACLAALISASLPVTGLIIWLKKKRKRRFI